MEPTNAVGLISTVVVAFALLVVFFIGIIAVYKTVKKVNQHRADNYISHEEAAKIKETQTSIISQLKAINKANRG